MRLADDLKDTLGQSSYALKPDVILTPDGPKAGHVMTVSEGKITAIEPDSGGDGIALPGHAVVPGFIDAHTHAGQTFGKSLIGGEPAQIWKRIWNPMEAVLTPEFAYVSAKWMFLESLRGGFTCLVNFSLNRKELNLAVHRAARETGIRLVSASGLDEYKFDDAGNRTVRAPEEVADMLEEHIALCADEDRIVPSICSTTFYTNSDAALVRLAGMCIDKNVKLQIHSNEHFPEVHECVVRFGKRPIEYLADIGILGRHLLLHHTTLITDREIELLAKSKTPVSYNPLASIWKGNAVAPALAFSARGVTFGIGSDTTSSDAFKNLCAAETCQRIEHAMPVDDFSCGAGWTWSNAASKGSAIAAGIDDATGALSPGLAADFLILDMIRPECLPSHDFEWEFVRYYNRDQVDAVVIEGEPVMFGGRPVGWDDESFMSDYLDAAKAIGNAPGIERVHGPSGRHRPGA